MNIKKEKPSRKGIKFELYPYREKPYYIKGNKENPDGVILALYGLCKEHFINFEGRDMLFDDLFNKHSGLRDNAGNEECIFYYDENFSKPADRIRLADECDSLKRELFETSKTWQEIQPVAPNIVELIKKRCAPCVE